MTYFKLYLTALLLIAPTHISHTYGDPNDYPDVKETVNKKLQKRNTNFKNAYLKSMDFACKQSVDSSKLSPEEKEFFVQNQTGKLIGVLFQLISESQNSPKYNSLMELLAFALQPEEKLQTKTDHQRLHELLNRHGSDIGLASYVLKKLKLNVTTHTGDIENEKNSNEAQKQPENHFVQFATSVNHESNQNNNSINTSVDLTAQRFKVLQKLMNEEIQKLEKQWDQEMLKPNLMPKNYRILIVLKEAS